jgi:NitT/TauT family transport system substrate-binding protein
VSRPLLRTVLLAASAAALAPAVCVPAIAAEKVIFQLGWVPGGTNGAEYLGITKHYFADEGLDVEIKAGNGGADAMGRIAGGAAQIGVTGAEAVMAGAAEGALPIKMIFSLYNKKPDDIETTTESGINSFKDLEGKKLGTTPYASSNVVWPLVAKVNGLDLSKVTSVSVDAAALAPMLAAGKVDAIMNWRNYAPVDDAVLAQAGKHVKVLPWSDASYVGYSQSVVANAEWLKTHGDAARGFIRAYIKALKYSADHPDEAGAAVAKLAKDVDPDVAGKEFAASVPLIFNENTKRDGLGHFNPELLKTTWEWVAKARKYKPDAIDPAALVDGSYLPK